MDNNPPQSPLPAASTPPPVAPASVPATPTTITGGEQKNSTGALIIVLIILSFLFIAPLGLILMWWKTNWPKWVKIAITVVVLLLMAGGVYFYMSAGSLSSSPAGSTFESEPVTSENTTATTSNDSSSWKTYTASTISFKYPDNMEVEETATDEFSVLDSGTEIISIDATTLTEDTPYQDLVDAMKEQIQELKEEKLTNGVKLTGLLGDEEDQSYYAIALLKGKVGVVTAATESEDQTEFTKQLKVLDQLIPTLVVK